MTQGNAVAKNLSPLNCPNPPPLPQPHPLSPAMLKVETILELVHIEDA